jgi:hypothetical protein
VTQPSNGSAVDRGAASPLTTMTHAKIRIQQGDLASARRILRAILESQPQHPEAAALLEGLSRPAASRSSRPDAISRSPEEVDAGDARTPEIVVDRLSQWLDRIKHNAGEGGA